MKYKELRLPPSGGMNDPTLLDTGLILVLLLSSVRGKKVRNVPKRVVKVVQTFANPVNAEQRRKWKQKITSRTMRSCTREKIISRTVNGLVEQ